MTMAFGQRGLRRYPAVYNSGVLPALPQATMTMAFGQGSSRKNTQHQKLGFGLVGLVRSAESRAVIAFLGRRQDENYRKRG